MNENISIALILGGYLLSPKEISPSVAYMAITNRPLSILVVIICSTVIVKNKELKQKVIIKKNKLAIANKELESFSFIASHDFQEPLRKVRNFVDVLLFKEKKVSKHQWEIFIAKAY